MGRCLLLLVFGVGVCARAAEEKPALFSPVSEEPEWRLLDSGQGSLTRQDFEERLRRTFDPDGALRPYLIWDEEGVTLFRDPARTRPLYRLALAPGKQSSEIPVSVLGGGDASRPLAGKVICLDPGHIGGDWADVEERTFRIGRDRPVVEGELNLRTCRLLAPMLEAAGAKVVWTHDGFEPTTPLRPADLYPEAITYLLQGSRGARLPRYSANRLIRWNAELLFYRSAEIQARARRVNEELAGPHPLRPLQRRSLAGRPGAPDFRQRAGDFCPRILHGGGAGV